MISTQPITTFDIEEGEDKLTLEQSLPLVLEILPGQAGEGLIDVYEPGSYEQTSLLDLARSSLQKKNWSIEEQQVLDDIKRQLVGGKMLWRGEEINDKAKTYAVVEYTKAGEKYFYVPIRVVKPQEGGASSLRKSFWSDA